MGKSSYVLRDLWATAVEVFSECAAQLVALILSLALPFLITYLILDQEMSRGIFSLFDIANDQKQYYQILLLIVPILAVFIVNGFIFTSSLNRVVRDHKVRFMHMMLLVVPIMLCVICLTVAALWAGTYKNSVLPQGVFHWAKVLVIYAAFSLFVFEIGSGVFRVMRQANIVLGRNEDTI
jgi:hypothetical protein